MTIVPSRTVLEIRAAVGVASVTSLQTPRDVPAVMLAGTARVALTRACMALTMRTTQRACAMSRVTMVAAVTSSAPTWDTVMLKARVCAISRLGGRGVKFQLAHGANSIKACVHPMACVTTTRTTAHVTPDGWVRLVTLVIVQESRTVTIVVTAMSRLIHPAARTVSDLGWDTVVMTRVSMGQTRQRTLGIVFAILAGWELDATQNVLVMGHLMESNVCVTTTLDIKEGSVTSRDVPDCTNSTVVAEVNVKECLSDASLCQISRKMKSYHTHFIC